MLRIRQRVVYLFFLCVFCFIGHAAATGEIGSIDPTNTGAYLAKFIHSNGIDDASAEINFGKFTTTPAYNISIDDTGFHGFAWGEASGWIVFNCANTVSGCSATNGNFKVSIDRIGVLSGYAWGENTGWINFGPFTTNTSQVKISDAGAFGGENGESAGYAWTQNFGWIVFDCSNSASCVRTNYIPLAYRPVTSVGSDSVGGTSQSSGSTTEIITTPPPPPDTTITEEQTPLPPPPPVTEVPNPSVIPMPVEIPRIIVEPPIGIAFPQIVEQQSSSTETSSAPIVGRILQKTLPPVVTEVVENLVQNIGTTAIVLKQGIKQVTSSVVSSITNTASSLAQGVQNGGVAVTHIVKTLGEKLHSFAAGITHLLGSKLKSNPESGLQSAVAAAPSSPNRYIENLAFFISIILVASIEIFRKKP